MWRTPVFAVLLLVTSTALAQPRIDTTLSFRRFRKASLLIPATMVAYGFSCMNNEELKEVNEEVREELWLEHKHPQMHIDNLLQWSPAVAVYGLNLLGIKGEHNLADRTIIYGISTLLMASTVYSTKMLSAQWRPDHSDHQSFPSGHTATAFAAAEFLRREYKDVSVWYGVAGYAAAAATGYLRMYNNKHWFSDVVAGAGIGILSTDAAYAIYPALKKMFSGKRTVATVIVPYYSQGATGLSLVHHF